MRILKDHMHGPDAVLAGCEAVETAHKKMATFIVAQAPTDGTCKYVELSVFTVWRGNQCFWRLRWEYLVPLDWPDDPAGECDLMGDWERQDAATAACRVLSRLAAVQARTGGYIFWKQCDDGDVQD